MGTGTDDTIREELRNLFAPEERAIVDARARAADARPVSPEEGALLRWLAGRLPRDAADVVEIGAAGGVGALHLVPALPPTATLTTIEPDANAHALAAEALEVAGHADRVRTILGEPGEVLPRLADARYAMCVLQVAPARHPALLDGVLRILAPGGLLVVRGVLRRGENGTVLARLLGTIAEHEQLDAVVLQEHEGVLLATRR